jgi:hypothetical protein
MRDTLHLGVVVGGMSKAGYEGSQTPELTIRANPVKKV